MKHNIRERAHQLAEQLVEWRRTIHKFPELSFQETGTAKFVKHVLDQIPGMQVQADAGHPNAVVGILPSGAGPIIAIRADMDALPIQEENKHAYQSQNKGIMHACGHDAHTAIALGAASVLGESMQNGELAGTVKFLFQPAEEMADVSGSTGAPYMIEAGVLDDVDHVLALHMSPENPVGEVKIHDGYSMANVDVFRAVIYGSGGHGAYPHLGTDPVWMLAPVLQALHGIVARKISPLDAAVVSVGSITSGSASNVIPSEVEIKGTVRSYDPDIRKKIHAELEKAFSVVNVLDGNYDLTITPEDPALQNHPDVNNHIRDVLRDVYPDFTILDEPFGLGGEDFAHMAQMVPGAMFFLGCAINDGVRRDLHTPTFDIDEQVLPVGVSILAESVQRYLQ